MLSFTKWNIFPPEGKPAGPFASLPPFTIDFFFTKQLLKIISFLGNLEMSNFHYLFNKIPNVPLPDLRYFMETYILTLLRYSFILIFI